MTINKKLTTVNFNNTNNTGRIKYIVIHYVGALGGAEANCNYYKSVNRNASAHYFVGFDGEIWQCVEDGDVAWHCGAKSYKHPECRNSNAIGIEMCVRKKNTSSMSASDKDWYFEDATVKATIELTKELMKKYNVPASNVIRHYDVTGKTCPAPYVHDAAAWNNFKAQLSGSAAPAPSQPSSNKTVASFPATPFTVQVIVPDLNYRSEPSMKGVVKGQTGKGSFTITEVKNGWGKLKSGAGWILIENPAYVTVGKSVAAAPAPAAPANNSYKVKVTASALNVRKGPGTNYGVATVIKKNEVYTIVDEKSGWGKLKSGAGWISLKYTQKI
jgi:N-acetylmuramoyl-L-alanine amidase CwlA